MIDWNEDNFLEKAMPRLRQRFGGPVGPCPDAEALIAVVEGYSREPERGTVSAHFSQCAACAELRNRLLTFESASPPEPEAAWNQTRARLDKWLERFLRSEAAHSRFPKRSRQWWRVSGWESISNFLNSRKIVWALGFALALAVIINGLLWLKYRTERIPPVQMAARTSVS